MNAAMRRTPPGLLPPAQGLRVNWQHPLADGLQACCVPVPGLVLDLAKPRGAAQVGQGFRARGITTKTGWFIPAANTQDCNFTSGRFSVAAVGVKTGTNPDDLLGRYSYSSESVNAGFGIGNGSTSTFVFQCFNNNAAANYNLTSTTQSISSGSQWTVGATSDATTRVLYLQGVRNATTTNSPTPATLTTGGSGLGSAASPATWELHIGCCWSRTLSDHEMAQFHFDPFCMLEPIVPLGVVRGPVTQVFNAQRMFMPFPP